jgi:hypothetical protein
MVAKEEERLENMRRRQQYGRIVREVFQPTADEQLQMEMDARLKKLEEMKRIALQRHEEGERNRGYLYTNLHDIFADRAGSKGKGRAGGGGGMHRHMGGGMRDGYGTSEGEGYSQSQSSGSITYR